MFELDLERREIEIRNKTQNPESPKPSQNPTQVNPAPAHSSLSLPGRPSPHATFSPRAHPSSTRGPIRSGPAPQLAQHPPLAQQLARPRARRPAEPPGPTRRHRSPTAASPLLSLARRPHLAASSPPPLHCANETRSSRRRSRRALHGAHPQDPRRPPLIGPHPCAPPSLTPPPQP